MKPEEKAKELVDRMRSSMIPHPMDFEDAKLCALIAVDELINEQSQYVSCEYCSAIDWQEVKQEIEKL